VIETDESVVYLKPDLTRYTTDGAQRDSLDSADAVSTVELKARSLGLTGARIAQICAQLRALLKVQPLREYGRYVEWRLLVEHIVYQALMCVLYICAYYM